MLNSSGKYGGLPTYVFVLFFFELIWYHLIRVIPFNYSLFLIFTLSTTFFLFCWAFLKFWSNKIDYMAIVVILVFIASTFIGILRGWYLKDILGDSIRFVAPFLAFYVGLNLFSRLDLEQIKKAFLLIIKGLFFIFLVEVFFEILDVFAFNRSFISYPKGGVRVPPLLISFLLLIAYLSKDSLIPKLKALLVNIVYILAPIMSASKSLLLSTVFVFLFTPFVFGNFKNKLLIALVSILGGIWIINLDVFVVNRLISSFLTLMSDESVLDASTGTRMLEVNSALNDVSQSGISFYSLIIGSGSGALWFPIGVIEHGLHAANFRPNGGAHHIHVELVSLWFRHGIVGLILYLLLIYKVIRSAFFVCKYFRIRDRVIFAMSGAIAVQYFASLFLMATGLSLYGHFYYAFIGAIVIVLHKKIKQLSS